MINDKKEYLPMLYNDLRRWIEAVEGQKDLKYLDNADRDLEIGAIADLYQERMGLPYVVRARYSHLRNWRLVPFYCLLLKVVGVSFEVQMTLQIICLTSFSDWHRVFS